MKRIFLLVMFLLALVHAQHGFACVADAECMPGSKCLKQQGQVFGVCVGGRLPGNSYDQTPVMSPPDPMYANTCVADVECGLNLSCIKSQGSVMGVCLRRPSANPSTPKPSRERGAKPN